MNRINQRPWMLGVRLVTGFVVLILCTPAPTTTGIESPYAQSKVESNLYFFLIPFRATNVAKTSEVLTFVLQTTNGLPRTVWLPKEDRFRFRANLFSTNGTAVPKTKLGRQVGSKFDSLSAEAADAKLFRGATSTGYVIPRLVDLFEVPAKGNYTFRFELQVIIADFPEKRQLVRFAPVEYSVFHQ